MLDKCELYDTANLTPVCLTPVEDRKVFEYGEPCCGNDMLGYMVDKTRST